jgi:polysaccharide biosynthesis/export protein
MGSRKISFFIITVFIVVLQACASQKKDVREYTAEEVKPLPISDLSLGPGDVIEITAWRHNDLNRKVQVDASGKIYYPFVGEIDVSDMSIHKLREVVRSKISKIYNDPVIDINIVSMQSRRIYVLGEIARPGIFSLSRPMDIFDAVGLSGGFTNDAKQENIFVIRGDRKEPQIIKLDMKAAMRGGDLEQNIVLQSGDVVYVPATYIASTSRYFRHLYNILAPIVILEQGIILAPQVGDALKGKTSDDVRTIIIERP